MPFKSEKQRRFMWAKHPKIAEAWAHGKHTSQHNKTKKKTAKRKVKRK